MLAIIILSGPTSHRLHVDACIRQVVGLGQRPLLITFLSLFVFTEHETRTVRKVKPVLIKFDHGYQTPAPYSSLNSASSMTCIPSTLREKSLAKPPARRSRVDVGC